MSALLRMIALGEHLTPTHSVLRPVTALRIVATDEIATHHRVTVILDGEAAWVSVPPPGDSCWGPVPPTSRDVLLRWPDGTISHQPADAFEGESLPIPRARSEPFMAPPRLPN